MRRTAACFSLVLALASASCTDGDPSPTTGGSGGGGGTSTSPTGGAAGDATGGTGGATGGTGGSSMSGSIVEDLMAIPGVLSVQEEPSGLPGHRFFFIDFEQPVDHADPDGQKFTQRLALHHVDTGAPFVLLSTGYWLYQTFEASEPTSILGANQLTVEHRYFSPSRPEPADWTLLDVEQAAADHHRIVVAFKTIYQGKWVSTGASKGGMTSIYHRRFYPSDVDATVAYVAPHSQGLLDPRYVDFLDEVGTAECRAALDDVSREALLRRPAMLQRMAEEADANGVAFDILGIDAAFESTVTSLPFAFWQYDDASSCGSIPGVGASDDVIWTFVSQVGLPIFSSDPYVLSFEPYYWQAYTELGTPGTDTSYLDDLLTVDFAMVDDLPSVDLTPSFDAAAMQDVSSWLAAEGSHILFVYGENDPWTAAAFDPTGAPDAHVFVAPGGNHGASIWSLTPGDQEMALDLLQAWTGVATKSVPPGGRMFWAEPLAMRRFLNTH